MLNETGYLIRLLKRILFLFILYSFCRIVFYALNTALLGNPPFSVFLHGIRFDLVSIFLLNSLYIILYLQPFRVRYNKVYQATLTVLFFITNIPALLVNLTDAEYFKFTYKRTTWDLMDVIAGGDDLKNLAPRFISDFWYIPLLFILAVAFLVIFYRRTRVSAAVAPTWKFHLRLAAFIIASGILLLGIRGGFQLKPLHILHAGNYVPARFVPLVLNTPFTLMKTIGDAQPVPHVALNESYSDSLFSPVKKTAPTDSTQKRNIVLIILESFGKEYTGAGGGESYTPFLDSLAGVSENFTNAYASGKKSIEAIPAILASIPAWSEIPYSSSPYIGNKINSIASILGENGYHTSFYHGARKGTMNIDAFCSMAGVKEYHSLETYPDAERDYDGNWGVFDEPYLSYFGRKTGEYDEPFFATVFTLTSHHPYSVPSHLKDYIRGGLLPIHRSVRYTDMSLRNYFNEISSAPWFTNTVFIITADHTGPSSDPFYSGRAGMYSVPLLIFDPAKKSGRENPQLVSHLEIMPIALNLAGVSAAYYSPGGNPAMEPYQPLLVHYLNGLYQVMDDEYLMLHDGSSVSGLYRYSNDPLLKENIMEKEKETAKMLEQKLGARLRYYFEGLTRNKMTSDAYPIYH